jgi:MFS family permease
MPVDGPFVECAAAARPRLHQVCVFTGTPAAAQAEGDQDVCGRAGSSHMRRSFRFSPRISWQRVGATGTDSRAVRMRCGRPRAFIASRVGGLPRLFWLLWTGTLVNRLGTMVMPFLAIYLTAVRGLPVLTTGAVLAVYGFGSLLSQLIGGWLTDQFSRRATLTGSMSATAAALIGLGYARGLTAITVTIFVLGVCLDMYRPASAALVADIVPPDKRPRAYGLLHWSINLGFAIATAAGGFLAREGFLLLFWIDAGTCALFAVLIWRACGTSDVRSTHRPEGPTSGGRRLGCGALLADRTMLGYALVIFTFATIYLQGTTTLPIVMREAGLTTTAYGTTIALNGVLIIVVQPLVIGWVADRDSSRVVAAGLTLLGGGFGLAAFAGKTSHFAASVVVWTAGEIVVMTVAQTIVAMLAPPQALGRYNGLYGLAWSLATLSAPLAGFWLFDQGGPFLLWGACFVAGLLAAAGQLLIAPSIRGRNQAAIRRDACKSPRSFLPSTNVYGEEK